MAAILNKWTLEIKGRKPHKNLMKEYEIEIAGMKYFYLLTVCTSVYNIIVTPTLYSNKGKSRLENTIFTIIADWTSLLLVTIFFIILPKKKCFFTGISYIPMILISLIETELNVYVYDEYSSINS